MCSMPDDLADMIDDLVARIDRESRRDRIALLTAVSARMGALISERIVASIPDNDDKREQAA